MLDLDCSLDTLVDLRTQEFDSEATPLHWLHDNVLESDLVEALFVKEKHLKNVLVDVF